MLRRERSRRAGGCVSWASSSSVGGADRDGPIGERTHGGRCPRAQECVSMGRTLAFGCCLALVACSETASQAEPRPGPWVEPPASSPDAQVGPADSAGSATAPWEQLFGTAGDDLGLGLDLGPDGDLYLCGATDGAMGGTTAGGTDLFVERRSPDGEVTWTRQIGSAGRDQAMAVSVSEDGTVYVGGMTTGDLFGQEPALVAGYVAALDSDGELLWSRRMGAGSVNRVRAARGGGVYVVGNEDRDGDQDAYLAHVRQAGEAWRTTFASDGFDAATDVRWSDDAGIYVSGFTGGTLPGQRSQGQTDAFVVRLDFDGEIRWLRQLGSEQFDSTTRVWLQGEGALIAGYTSGEMEPGAHRGDNDVLLARFSRQGDVEWVRQWGTAGSEAAYGIAGAGDSGIVLVGRIDGAAWPGFMQAGAGDAFMLQVSGTGQLTAHHQQGTSAIDEFQDVVAMGRGAYAVVGYSEGAPDTLSPRGKRDVWLAVLGAD